MGKTHSDKIDELIRMVTTHTQQLENHLKALDQLRDANQRVTDRLNEAQQKVAVLESLVADLKESTKEAERRRWMVLVAFFGSLLALVNGLILLFVRR